MPGRDDSSLSLFLAWKSIYKEIIAYDLCKRSQKAQTGELEPFLPFSLSSLAVKWDNCEVPLLCSAAVDASTNKNTNIHQVLQVGLPDLKLMSLWRSDIVPAVLSFWRSGCPLRRDSLSLVLVCPP